MTPAQCWFGWATMHTHTCMRLAAAERAEPAPAGHSPSFQVAAAPRARCAGRSWIHQVPRGATAGRSNGRTGAAAAGGLAAPSRHVNDVTPATPGAGRARATPIIVTVTGPPKSAPPISVHFFSAVNATCRDDDGKTCGGHCMPAFVDMRAGADPTNCQPPPAGGRAAGHGRAPSAVHLGPCSALR